MNDTRGREQRVREEREAREQRVAKEVLVELGQARNKFAHMASGHEAVGVIDEEFQEFKLAVYFGIDHRGLDANPRTEAIQLAAMAIRYIIDCTPGYLDPRHEG